MDSKLQSRNTNGYRERRNHHRYHNQDDDNKIDCSIMINNLISKTTRFELKKLFKHVGRIVNIYMSMDPNPWKMGKAEITFEKRSQAVQACTEFDGYRIGEDAIRVSLLNSRAPRGAPRKVKKPHHSHWPVEDSMESRSYNRHEEALNRSSRRLSASYRNSQIGTQLPVNSRSPREVHRGHRRSHRSYRSRSTRDNKNKTHKKPITAADLDAELDEYMKINKTPKTRKTRITAEDLDAELDEYMKAGRAAK